MHLEPSDWPQRDLSFVTTEIGREFPHTSIEEIAAAVANAANTLPPSEGRVALTVATRALIRQHEPSA